VRVSDLTIRYGDATLFRHLNMTLPAGGFTCLLGRSGVGKTTLARAIVGLATGSLVTGIIETTTGGNIAGDVAWMSQEDLLLPWLTLIENVMLGAKLRGEPTDDARARELIRRVGLDGSEDQLPLTLSGGMRQRAALARTLMEDTQVVVLDEPFSAVDAITRFELQELAHALLRERVVLLITHDPLEAVRLGEQIYVLTGRPATVGDPLQVCTQAPRAPGSNEVRQGVEFVLEELGRS
jgi:putative hydroxymethylpyrimidine transport system ATP-binding protein